MSDELDSLVKQMYQRGILYREAVSEFQKVFVASALREYRGNSPTLRRSWACIGIL